MAIDFSQLQMPNIAGNFMQGLQLGQQQRQQQLQQQKAMQRAQQMQQDIAAWRGDMSPDRTANLLMQYPELKDQITSARTVLSDAAKKDSLGFMSKALMLSRAGADDRFMEFVNQRAGALRAAGKEDAAKEMEASLGVWKLDKKAGEGMLSLGIAAEDPDLYKTVFGQGEKTTMEKEYDAIAARSGKGVADSWWEAQITKDKLIPVAGVGLFRAEDLGKQENLPRINTKEEADKLAPGARFIAPDGSIKTKPGGGVSNGTGSFR